MAFTDSVLSLITYLILGLFGVLLADISSGLVHWFIDRYGDPKWPIIGWFIRDNQAHHRDAAAFLEGGFMHRNVGAMALVGALFLLFWVLGWLNIVTLTALIVGAFGNELHAFSHRAQVPLPVRWAQSFGLLQRHNRHVRHHIHGQDTYYCVITAWLNPWLDRFGFWTTLERIIERVTGVEAQGVTQVVHE